MLDLSGSRRLALGSDPPTFADAVRHHACVDPTDSTVRVLGSSDESLSYADLWERGRAMADGLRESGLGAGDRIAVSMSTTMDVVTAVVALSAMGAVLVPVQPPSSLRKGSDAWSRVASALSASNPSVFIGGMDEQAAILDLVNGGPCRAMGFHRIYGKAGARDPKPNLPHDDLAMIQFSSGSTGSPKGICLTRGNLASNLEAIVSRIEAGPDEVAVSWLPLYHDLGLVSVLMTCLWAGSSVVLYPASLFVRNPLGWLVLASQTRATMTAAPQFAYGLCASKLELSPKALDEIDLRAMRWMFNGSEFVHWETCARFEHLLRDRGLRENALQPGYGLAENCVGVTLRRPLTPVKLTRLPRLDSPDEERGSSDWVTLVGNGFAVDGTEVEIRTSGGTAAVPGEIGEIHISGSSTTASYLLSDGVRIPATTDGWLATGDLGAFVDGELFIVGRQKEIIKLGGRTICPPDVEASLAAALDLPVDGVAVFSFYDSVSGSERPVVVVEMPRRQIKVLPPDLTDRVRRYVLREFQLQLSEVHYAPRGALPRTSSGKIRRVHLSRLAASAGLVAYLQAPRSPSVPLSPEGDAGASIDPQ